MALSAELKEQMQKEKDFKKINDTIEKLARSFNRRPGDYQANLSGHVIALEEDDNRGFTVYVDDNEVGDSSSSNVLISASVFVYLYGTAQERFYAYLNDAPDADERDMIFHLVSELTTEPAGMLPASVVFNGHEYEYSLDTNNSPYLSIDTEPLSLVRGDIDGSTDAVIDFLAMSREQGGSDGPGSAAGPQNDESDRDDTGASSGSAPDGTDGNDDQQTGRTDDRTDGASDDGPGEDDGQDVPDDGPGGNDGSGDPNDGTGGAGRQHEPNDGPGSTDGQGRPEPVLNGHDIENPYSRFHYSGMGSGVSAYAFNIRGLDNKAAGKDCEECSYVKTCELEGQSITVAAIGQGHAGRNNAAVAVATLAAKGPVDYLVSVIERYDASKNKDTPFDFESSLYRALARTNRLISENIAQYNLSDADPSAGLTLAVYDGSNVYYLNVGAGGLLLYNKEGKHSNSFRERVPSTIRDKFEDDGKFKKGARVTVRTVKDVAAFSLLSEGMYDRMVDPHAGIDQYEADQNFYSDLSARTDDAVGDLLDRHVNRIIGENPAQDMSSVFIVNQDVIRTVARQPFDRNEYQKDVNRGKEVDGISGAVREFVRRYELDKTLFETDNTGTKGESIYSMVAAGHMMQMTEYTSVKSGEPQLGYRIELDGRTVWDERTPMRRLEDTVMNWLDQMENSGRAVARDVTRNEEMKAQSLQERFPDDFPKKGRAERKAADAQGGRDDTERGEGPDTGNDNGPASQTDPGTGNGPRSRSEKYIAAMNGLYKQLNSIESEMLRSYEEGNGADGSSLMKELKDTRDKLRELRKLAVDQHIPFKFDVSQGMFVIYEADDILDGTDNDERTDEEIMEDADNARASADNLLRTFPQEFQEAIAEISGRIDKEAASYRDEAVIATLKSRMGLIEDAIDGCNDHIDHEKDFATKRWFRNYREELEERLETISCQLEAVEKCVDSSFKSRAAYILIHQFKLEKGADKVLRDIIEKEIASGSLNRQLDDIREKHKAALDKSYDRIQTLCGKISVNEAKISKINNDMKSAEQRHEGFYTFLSNVPFLKRFARKSEHNWKGEEKAINLGRLVRMKKLEVCNIAAAYYDELQEKQMEIASVKKISASFEPEMISAKADPILKEMAFESLDLFRKDVVAAISAEHGKRDLSSYSLNVRDYQISFRTSAGYENHKWSPGGWSYSIDGKPATENDVIRLIKTDLPSFNDYCSDMRDRLSIGQPSGRDEGHSTHKR